MDNVYVEQFEDYYESWNLATPTLISCCSNHLSFRRIGFVYFAAPIQGLLSLLEYFYQSYAPMGLNTQLYAFQLTKPLSIQCLKPQSGVASVEKSSTIILKPQRGAACYYNANR